MGRAPTIRTVHASDGTPLVVHHYTPSGGMGADGPGKVVLAAAMGVPQDFYAPFAQWLAQQGWQVCSFDYRGCGHSRAPEHRHSLRRLQANLFDWARDYEAVIDHVAALPGSGPLLLLGHSLGGQLPGMLRNGHKVHGLLGVAAGSGYWRDNAPALRRKVPFFWFFLVPVFTRLYGYFPGKRLGAVGDLPAGVVRQWRRWCMHPQYSAGAEGEPVRQTYAQVRFPVVSVAFPDDELLSAKGMEVLLGLYRNAPRELVTIAPEQVQARRIGHFGAFRPEQAPQLWPRLHHYLSRLAAPPSTHAG
ncbi:MAG: Alpha/beta fold hydrolase [Pseudomonadota bacterium]|jgi:predicted alpha/beta hydrolase|nr:Alpha/beta fold hydrolase [Pseudomonadota bacterium]